MFILVKMRSTLMVFVLASLVVGHSGPSPACKSPPLQMMGDPSTIPAEVCPPNQHTMFATFAKPIHFIINKWLRRQTLDVDDLQQILQVDPWSITNVPNYANYTPAAGKETAHWNVRVHGHLYKRSRMDQNKVDHLINKILIRASIFKEKLYGRAFDQLTKSEGDQARRQVRELGTVAIMNGAIEMKYPDLCSNSSTILRHLTNNEGAFDEWVSLRGDCSKNVPDMPTNGSVSNQTLSSVPLNVGGMRQNESKDTQPTFFVPPRGLTIISDVDDVLRVAEVWNWKQAILDLFTRPYEPWLNMTRVYSRWGEDIPNGRGVQWRNNKLKNVTRSLKTNVHFHYITDTPEVNAEFYINGTVSQ